MGKTLPSVEFFLFEKEITVFTSCLFNPIALKTVLSAIGLKGLFC